MTEFRIIRKKEYGLDFKKNDANERTVDVNGKYTNIEMYEQSCTRYYGSNW